MVEPAQKHGCRRCSECPDSEHHWMPNGDFGADDNDAVYLEGEHRHPTGNMYKCKHCHVVGDDCRNCNGTGEVEDEENVVELPCFDCGGDGIVVAAPRSFASLGLDDPPTPAPEPRED